MRDIPTFIPPGLTRDQFVDFVLDEIRYRADPANPENRALSEADRLRQIWVMTMRAKSAIQEGRE